MIDEMARKFPGHVLQMRKPGYATAVLALLAVALAAHSGENITLMIYANGREIAGSAELSDALPASPSTTDLEAGATQLEAARVALHDHDTMQLVVMRTTGPGAPVDVTSDPHTTYSSSVPWLVTVSPTGLVTAKAEPGFGKASTRDKNDMRDDVSISVTYIDDQSRQGGNMVFLKVLP